MEGNTLSAASDQKDFEDALGRNRQHTNKQTFSSDSSVLIAEVIDTPGVDIAGRMGCLITAIQVVPNLQVAAVTLVSHWRTQICGGVQSAFLMPDDPKYIAEYRRYIVSAANGVSPVWNLPMIFMNPTKPMLIVNPKMTIMHISSNVVDLASDDVYTMFTYQNVPLTIEMHTSLLHAQMDLT